MPTIQFVNLHEPPLKPGDYELVVQHDFQVGTNDPQKVGRTCPFTVGGGRFSLRPALVGKVFPPRNTLGDYDAVLPHVVFTRRTLPWERSVSRFDASSEDVGQGASWLALFVFKEDEAPPLTRGTFADLCPPDGAGTTSTTGTSGGTLPSSTLSYGTPAGSQRFLETGENMDDACSWFEVSVSTFCQSAPSIADLTWTAHARVRQGSTEEPSDHAVVVANRLPCAGHTSLVHLVSLEGLGQYLPDADGSASDALTRCECTIVRLVSLVSWSFRVAPQRASFAAMLHGLNQGATADSLLRISAGASSVAGVKGALDAGYTALAHEKGSNTGASWYRGPFLPALPEPADVAAVKAIVPAGSASDFASQHTGTGLTDESLSAAWEIGRLLALADGAFTKEQVSWKRDCRLALNVAFQGSADATGSRATRATTFKTKYLASKSQIQTSLGSTLVASPPGGSGRAIPAALVESMQSFALLRGVPFSYVVPNAGMLPPESIRFFSVDHRWITALLDGAWSLGREPKGDWALDDAYAQLLFDLLEVPAGGVLINSHLVSAYWPGIVFEPTRDGKPVAMLREDRLGPDMLLLLFADAIDSLTVSEPPEGLHFGFEMASDGSLRKPLRFVTIGTNTYPVTSPGGTLGAGVYAAPGNNGGASSSFTASEGTNPPATIPVPMRSWGVIQLDALASSLNQVLGVGSVAAADTFTAAEFALELVEGVESVTFQAGS